LEVEKRISNLQELVAGLTGSSTVCRNKQKISARSLPFLPKSYRKLVAGSSRCQQSSIANNIDVKISSVKSKTGKIWYSSFDGL
jgi:hypothetical protein